MSARSTVRRVLCVALALGAALAFAPPAGAAGDDLPVTVRIDQISPSVLRPGDSLTVRATVTNTSAEVLEKPTATLRLSPFRISDRDDLEAWTSATTCSSTSRCPSIATAALPQPLAVGQSATVELAVDPSKIPLLDLPDTWGPRGLSVEVTDGRTQVGLERTFLLWFPDASKISPTPLSVLVPVVGPGADPLSPQSTSLDALVAPGGRLDVLAETLASHADIGVAVDPALLASAATGSSRAQAWGSSLEDDLAHHDVLTLPWSDPDIGAAAHAGQAALVQLAVDASVGAGIDASGILWTPAVGSPDQTTLAVAEEVHEGAVVVAPGRCGRGQTEDREDAAGPRRRADPGRDRARARTGQPVERPADRPDLRRPAGDAGDDRPEGTRRARRGGAGDEGGPAERADDGGADLEAGHGLRVGVARRARGRAVGGSHRPVDTPRRRRGGRARDPSREHRRPGRARARQRPGAGRGSRPRSRVRDRHGRAGAAARGRGRRGRGTAGRRLALRASSAGRPGDPRAGRRRRPDERAVDRPPERRQRHQLHGRRSA